MTLAMPDFELVSLDQAISAVAEGSRNSLLAEYIGYIQQLEPQVAGSLEVADEERPGVVSARLHAAARRIGEQITIRRYEHRIVFWLDL